MKQMNESAVVTMEVAYLLNKIAAADAKKKTSFCHYSVLYKATMDYLKDMGIKCENIMSTKANKPLNNYRIYVPAHQSHAYKALKDWFDKQGKEPDVLQAEFDYIIEKVRLAKDKDKKFTSYYSTLRKPTLKRLAVMGIKYEIIGNSSHKYRFYYPEKKTKAWYRLINYGKSKRAADGTFVKKSA